MIGRKHADRLDQRALQWLPRNVSGPGKVAAMDAMGLLVLVVALLIGAGLGAAVMREMMGSKRIADAAAARTELPPGGGRSTGGA